jgi:cellulose synthase/poly-beta-1,6-N-acetylglucosamine synthase-like glycosyltransferase
MTPPITILITAWKEPETLRTALEAIRSQVDANAQIIVICPDDPTAHSAQQFAGVEVIRDPAQGKPAALNLGLQAARADLIVMTDGDVCLAPDALAPLLAPFADPQVGAVSGHPVSISPRTTMLGYWSHLLTEAGAHRERVERDARGQFFVCSGYLYAIRRPLIESIPEDALAEDAVVSHLIAEQGYRVRYAPDAVVYVKYPTTYADWLKQKVRSAGGYAQPVIAKSPLRMRSFQHEALHGPIRVLTYPRSIREMVWSLALFGARLHLWLLIFWRVRVQKTPLTQLWQRVESTK